MGGLLDDTLRGGPGNDSVVGNDGDDDVFGGDGDDAVYGNSGVDLLDGGDGNDYLAANETPPEVDDDVSCGAGDDVVSDYSDGDPIADDCETVDPPYLDGDPVITGDPRVGSLLSLSLPANLGSDGVALIEWERCDAAGNACSAINGANAQTYTPTTADLGYHLRAGYTVENALGEDFVESAPTSAVRAARQPPAPRPPVVRPSVPRPPVQPAVKPAPSIFAALAKPKLAIRAGRLVVDTGRTVGCPNLGTGSPCRVTASARTHGKSAGGATSVVLGAGAHTRLALTLNARAHRLLVARRKLTISVTWRISRATYGAVGGTFTITVRLPPRKHR